ncbi:hypothetical protein, partial [Thermolongibacillus altinsuensis]|uniref:hypothetical protein n=1 Tax=Thermolongibacillus altinsuensis TaxID=575256 RepID=UPI002557683A
VSALYAATRTIDLIFFRGELIKYVDVTFAPLGPDRMAEFGAVVVDGEHRSHIKPDLAKFHSE